MITSKQRAELRGMANTYTPCMQIGKGGITDTVIAQANTELDSKELIKIQVLETAPESARESAVKLVESLGADIVQVIGRKFVIYRENPDKDKKEKKPKKPAKPAKKKKPLLGKKERYAEKMRKNSYKKPFEAKSKKPTKKYD